MKWFMPNYINQIVTINQLKLWFWWFLKSCAGSESSIKLLCSPERVTTLRYASSILSSLHMQAS